MATIKCSMCDKNNSSYPCQGCQGRFCLEHLIEHDRQLNQQLHETDNQAYLFKQKLYKHQRYLLKNTLLEEVDRWEQNSICLVQQTAEDARKILHECTDGHLSNIEISLDRLTNEIKQLRNNTNFNEINLNSVKTQLGKLQEQLVHLDDIVIKEESTLIKKIDVVISSRKQPNLSIDTKWDPNGITIAGGNGLGTGIDQLGWPWGMDIDNNQTFYIADYWNHRIVEWKKDAKQARIVAGGHGQGNQSHQLNHPINVIVDHHHDALIIADYDNRRVVQWPRPNGQNGKTIISDIKCFGLAMNNHGHLYVSDEEKHEVRRWKIGDKEGTLVAGGHGQGCCLNQLNQPWHIFIGVNESIYISDKINERIMKWVKDAKEGIIVAGGNGQGNNLTQFNHPHGLFVDSMESIYVADCGNDRVVRWLKGSKQGEVIAGGNGRGDAMNQLNLPIDLSLDEENNLYVVDNKNQRVQKFYIIQNKRKRH